jgi:hypothetical protein
VKDLFSKAVDEVLLAPARLPKNLPLTNVHAGIGVSTKVALGRKGRKEKAADEVSAAP